MCACPQVAAVPSFLIAGFLLGGVYRWLKPRPVDPKWEALPCRCACRCKQLCLTFRRAATPTCFETAQSLQFGAGCQQKVVCCCAAVVAPKYVPSLPEEAACWISHTVEVSVSDLAMHLQRTDWPHMPSEMARHPRHASAGHSGVHGKSDRL